MGSPTLVDYLQCPDCAPQSRRDCPAYRSLSHDRASSYRNLLFAQAQIQHAFEERVGHEVDESTIYRLLSRHGWRKLMPRSKHPKADPQVQEQFKANFSAQVEAAVATREVGDEHPVLIMARDEGCFGRISRAKRCSAHLG